MSDQPRIMPDKPGWWWYQLRDEDDNVLDAEVEWVNLDHRGVFMLQVFPPRPVTSSEIVMLAPIPGPAVLAALAEYTAAIYAIDAAPYGSVEREEAFEDWEAARSKLHAAIRAERDAERDGAA